MSLSISALALVIFGGVGTMQVLTEKHDLERALLRDASTLCQATAESARRDLARHDPQASAALLQSFHRYDADLDVTLWRAGFDHPRPPSGFPERAAYVDGLAEDAVRSGDVVSELVELTDGRRVAIVASPIDSNMAQEERSAVVLVHPLDEIDADVRAAAAMAAMAVVLFSLLGGLLGWVLGESYIVRPLRRLDEAMSLVAAGDLTAPPLGGSGDEVGRVLAHFDEVRAELAKAWDTLETEQDAHRSTLERLANADRLVTVGQLAAGLAHEIGSPLQILGGRARKLVSRAEPQSDVERTASIIVTQTDRITGIVRKLLQFARPRATERHEANPVTCIAPVVDLLELEADRRGAHIRFESGPGVEAHQSVLVDADALQQIVFNLARNGLAAVERGGTVELHVEITESENEPRLLQMVVSDDGAGFSEEDRPRAFEPFFTTRGGEGGVGLGLSVVRSIVEGLGGTISLAAREPKGTKFIVSIPC